MVPPDDKTHRPEEKLGAVLESAFYISESRNYRRGQERFTSEQQLKLGSDQELARATIVVWTPTIA